MRKKIILASGSSRRKELLEKAGLVFDVVKSDYEEDMTLALSPQELAEHLSKGKAEDVAKKFSDAVIIAADTFIVHRGNIIGKPHTSEKAKEILRSLSGASHTVLTGLTIIDTESGKTISRTVETHSVFKELTRQDIDEYVATGDPLDKAGAYAIQTIGGKWIERIEGSMTNVIGLPMEALVEELKKFTLFSV